MPDGGLHVEGGTAPGSLETILKAFWKLENRASCASREDLRGVFCCLLGREPRKSSKQK
jgi:hypothetical protein